MTRTRPTLLAYVIAASFVTNFLLILFVWLAGPESPGIDVAWMGAPVVVQSVVPGSPSALAGIRAGDRLVAANGGRIHDFIDWQRVDANLERGRALHLSIERAGARIQRDLTFHSRPLRVWISSAGLLQLTFIGAQLVYIGLAVLILFARPRNVGALFGALLLGVCGTVATVRPEGIAAAWRQTPFLLPPLLWINELIICIGFGISLTFLILFPRPLPKTRLILFIVWIPDLVIQPWILRFVFNNFYLPDHAVNLPDWLATAIPVYWLCTSVQRLPWR